MLTAARKQSHAEFSARVARVNRNFVKRGGYRRPPRPGQPIASTLMGFGWIYVVIAVAVNRETIEASLRQGSLPLDYHGYILGALTALLAASTVLLAMHLLRCVSCRGPARSNSRAILLGALGAMALVFTPDAVWQTGAAMLDTRSMDVLTFAGKTIEDGLNIDFSSITLASSSGF